MLDLLLDLLLPTTDRGVAVQAVVVLAILAGALLAARRHREWRLVVVGAALLAVGAFGLRALH